MTHLIRFLMAAILALTIAPTAQAGDMGYAPDKVAQVDVLPGWRLPDGTHMAAIRIRLAEGWKTYWRAPGDAGIPPAFDWSGSRNLGAVAFQWPTPQVFETNGMRTIGYSHELVLPARLTPLRAEDPISLKGRLAMGVCRDVCMPMQTRLKATLPVVTTPDAMIERALAQRPDTAREAGLRSATCRIDPIADGLRLTTRLTLPRLGREEVVVMELPDPAIWVSEANVTRSGDTLVATSEMVAPDAKPFLLSRDSLRFTLLSNGRAVDIRGCAPAK
ncbi:protein-disulfide reductase DsbD domain-containing protein [Aliiroseovarius subalbicans]|uniref:protein-disulfide reductase DsbD domain-containing protein n=1 Tax=Aliiroseovarius subalbicans TaxID=2925840 RepID=UPI001F5ADCCF|nr:protein-disulfide reductase DsbD domain-containing protein [Aliiroseovarius subalbicans]MCI2399567.1 hypothetical protein [Aliiroseovarius subalbicans]